MFRSAEPTQRRTRSLGDFFLRVAIARELHVNAASILEVAVTARLPVTDPRARDAPQRAGAHQHGVVRETRCLLRAEFLIPGGMDARSLRVAFLRAEGADLVGGRGVVAIRRWRRRDRKKDEQCFGDHGFMNLGLTFGVDRREAASSPSAGRY